MFLIATSAVFSSASFGTSESWLDQLVRGRNRQAAEQLVSMTNEISGKVSPYFKELVLTTATSIANGANECPEEAKLTLFRGMSEGKHLYRNVGTKSNPIFLSRALMDKRGNLSPRKFLALRNANFIELISHHSHWYKYKPSPFLSTTTSPHIAEVFAGGGHILVLRICPQRAIYNGNGHEFEALIPFLIQSKEIFAIVSPLPNSNSFKIVYNGDKNSSSEETLNQVKKYIATANKSSNGSEYEVGRRFERSHAKKLKMAERYREECESLLEYTFAERIEGGD